MMFSRRLGGLACLLLAAIILQVTSPAAADPGSDAWDPSLPRVTSAGAPGDPLAIANASLRATAQAAQTTMDLGRSFLHSLGLGGTGGAEVTRDGLNRVSGSQAIEYVIRRAGSQIGVPYSWGGGSLTGPSNGIDSGSGTVGFDCSGLTRYAYAGVGVLLPRWSGDQYNAGAQSAAFAGETGRPAVLGGPGAVSTRRSTWVAARCSKLSRQGGCRSKCHRSERLG